MDCCAEMHLDTCMVWAPAFGPWLLLFYVALYSKSCVCNVQTKARRELVVRKQKLF